MRQLVVAVALSALAAIGAGADDKPQVLTLAVAQKLAAKAAAHAKGKGWHVSVAVVHADGQLVYFQRDDEAYLGSIDASIQKARSANAFQRPTSAFVAGLKEGRTGLLSVPGIVAIEGGVPIKLGGKFAGAIGVSGAKSTEDEECAKAALEE